MNTVRLNFRSKDLLNCFIEEERVVLINSSELCMVLGL